MLCIRAAPVPETQQALLLKILFRGSVTSLNQFEVSG
jgi:hypothetical protein